MVKRTNVKERGLPSQTPTLWLSSATTQLPWRWCKQLNSTEYEGWVSCCCSLLFHSPRLMMCSEGRWSNKLQADKKKSFFPHLVSNEIEKSTRWITKKRHENQSVGWCLPFQAHFSTAATNCLAAHLFLYCSLLFLIKFTKVLLLF